MLESTYNKICAVATLLDALRSPETHAAALLLKEAVHGDTLEMDDYDDDLSAGDRPKDLEDRDGLDDPEEELEIERHVARATKEDLVGDGPDPEGGSDESGDEPPALDKLRDEIQSEINETRPSDVRAALSHLKTVGITTANVCRSLGLTPRHGYNFWQGKSRIFEEAFLAAYTLPAKKEA